MPGAAGEYKPVGPGSGTAGAIIPAFGNLTFNVSTQAQLVAALAAAALYDYQYTYTLTINVADGTYIGGIKLPRLYRYPVTTIATYPTLLGDTSTPANCVIESTTGDAVFTETGAVWSLFGFRLKSTTGTNCDLNCTNYSLVEIGLIDFAGSGTLCSASNHSLVFATGNNLTSSSSAFVAALVAAVYSGVITDGGTWTINNSPTVSSFFAQVGDHAILGNGTFVNAGTVTGVKYSLYNFGTIEFASADSNFPGSSAGSIFDQTSIFQGNGGVEFHINNASGALVADYGITTANTWTFQNGFGTVSSSTSGTGIAVQNSSAGGRSFVFFTAGSAGSLGLSAGESCFLDGTSGNIPLWVDTSANVTFIGVIGLSAATAYSANAADTGLSRVSAGVLALGTGAAGSTAGTLKLTDLFTNDASALIQTGTTLNNGAGSNTVTITNAPASGAPSKWIPIIDNGTTRYIPTWT